MKKKAKLPTPNSQLPTPNSQLPIPNKPSDSATAKQLMDQYRVAVAADVEAARQKLKFGAMLALWANYLGCGAGRGHDGEGLKGWLEANCPGMNYNTAIGYKCKAEKAAEMLGGGRRAMASLLSLCNEGDALQIEAPGEVIELTEKERKAASKLCENVESLGQLEQMYFDFAEKEKRRERRRNTGDIAESKLNAHRVLSPRESAAILWGDAMKPFVAKRGAFFSAAKNLDHDLAASWLEELKMLCEVLQKRIDAVK